MTPAQIATLRTVVMAEPGLAAARQAGNDAAIAAWCNALASPAFVVYKSVLSRHDIITGTSTTGTTFAWAGAAYITRSQGERDAFREMFNSTGTVVPSLSSIQGAFADIFSGAGGAGNRAHIDAMSRRSATRAEKALSTGTGTTLAPAILGYETEITVEEAGLLR